MHQRYCYTIPTKCTTVDKYLNCIITKYTVLHVSARESYLQGDLYMKEFWLLILQTYKYKNYVQDNSHYKYIWSINNPGIFCLFSSINSKHDKFKSGYLALLSIQELPKWDSDKTWCSCLRRAPDSRGLAFNCLELLLIGPAHRAYRPDAIRDKTVQTATAQSLPVRCCGWLCCTPRCSPLCSTFWCLCTTRTSAITCWHRSTSLRQTTTTCTTLWRNSSCAILPPGTL